MEKTRVYELAKELNTNSKTLIEKLKKININVKNHMSIIEEDELKAIYEYFGVNIKSIKGEDSQKEVEAESAEELKPAEPEEKAETPKPKKNAPRIIRTEVREIRTDALTGITTEIRTEIKGDRKREVRTNITNTKPESPKPDRRDFFEFKSENNRRRPYDSRVQVLTSERKEDRSGQTVGSDAVEKEERKGEKIIKEEKKTEPVKDTKTEVSQENAKPLKADIKPRETSTERKKEDAPAVKPPEKREPQRPSTGYRNERRPYQGGQRQGFEGRPPYGAGASTHRKKETDHIGEQLKAISKDAPKAVEVPSRSVNRTGMPNKDKGRDVSKREPAKPFRPSGKQERNIQHKAIKTLGHERTVDELLNDDELLLSLYDGDNQPKKQKKGAAGRSKRPGGNINQQPEPVKVLLKVSLPESLTVKDLAERLKKQAAVIIKKLLSYGIMAAVNQEIDYDTAATIAEEFGYQVEKEIIVSEEDILFDDTQDNQAELHSRAPVVVVMGHVDHGKTSLLDAIREANVMVKEAGGITQHIGAYSVKINDRKITFLDTPGHEAFTAMRARGAQVTDIAILVVAADDGVMPQTIEAINHAKAANVSIIVAVNKIDKPGADPDRVKQELMEHGLVPEEWGGDTTCVNVSAKQREGIENLLEMVLLVADILDLKANPNKQAKGTVIEAKLDKGRGPVATVLVQRGTLKVGECIITGSTVGRIRAMTDDKGQKVKKATPSTPVEIIGLPDVPEAGDIFYAITDEKTAKQLAEKRLIKHREQTLNASTRVTLDDLYNQIKQGKVKDLNIIVKADVQGSVEAIKQSLEKISNEEVRVRIIHGAVGAITESDVMLANVSNAIIIGFNVRPEATARTVAERENVDIKLYRVIYEAIDDITSAMKGMLEPKFREAILGHAEVRQTFKASGIGTIAGCHVTDGKILRNSDIRIIRNSIVVHEGKIASLKRFKEDVKEVATGFECGINLEKFNDIKEGDIIEAFTMEQIAVE